jgi:hypothetical protein
VVKLSSAQDYLYRRHATFLHYYRSIEEGFPNSALHPSYARPFSPGTPHARLASWFDSLPGHDKRLWDVDAFLRGETDTLKGYDRR